MSLEEKFEKIARTASEEAADVVCPRERYEEGLEWIIGILQEDLHASRSFGTRG